MGLIDRETRRGLYLRMSQNNLERQFSLLADMVRVGIEIPRFKINLHIIRSLHSISTTHLVEQPGEFRTEPAFITESPHVPADPRDIPNLIRDLIVELHESWDKTDAFHLAANVLWKLVWIHPFDDGNGRTARALAFLVISLKYKILLFGSKSFTSFLRDDFAQHYIAGIRHADRTFAEGEVDLLPLAELLGEIVVLQLSSQPE
jgi:Fic family protein